MSPLLLRAVASAGGPEARSAGMIWVAAGRVGVWASRFEERAELGRAEMLEHHRLVEATCAAGPCLPVRLGTWAESEEEARGLLVARQDALLAALARVEGKVEVAASWLWRGDAGPRPSGPHSYPGPLPEGEGTRYLRQRRLEIVWRQGREARAKELIGLVERAAGVAGVEAQHRVCPSETVALSSALLVGRAGSEAAIAAVRSAASGLADVEVVVIGPWPPYSFAGIA